MLCSCSLTYISSTHCEVGAGVGVGVEWVGFFCDTMTVRRGGSGGGRIVFRKKRRDLRQQYRFLRVNRVRAIVRHSTLQIQRG